LSPGRDVRRQSFGGASGADFALLATMIGDVQIKKPPDFQPAARGACYSKFTDEF
jgi:hypothetical protein